MSTLNINSKYRMPSGYDIPILGFGVYQTPADVTSDVVQHALNVGYRHVDSAVAYHNEAPSAEGMKKSGILRADLFFTTKIPPRQMTYDNAKQHIENTLKVTGFDYVDLYLLHAPYGGKENRIGAWKALVEGVQAGKIRSIGVSNYGCHHLDELESWIKSTEEKDGQGKGGILSVNQIELHPWLARKDIVEWCQKRGVIVEAYSPLVRATKANDPLLVEAAKKYGKTTAQILLRWSLQKGFVPLPKSVTKSRIEENSQIYDFELSEEEMQKLDTGVYEPCAWDPTVSHD
ncbi:2,5-diketo-D-gluconic acid reductase A [Lindgomyces ingoldianus]|uniref:2,5-diketo-D-gluconic acid reductase A n=1 Tax=Lindgomyces ingoldianus TaxID=673940 RepID=A0ACB6QGM4_9PLEO|nr:2,5-diketo-D-gluconic acid reductase A [Lindgomyces ingoldianus]KAF2465291.1 2,5-diketo-D-gluconic acid reductase A [Lindgomyces ingoldianus]